MCRPESGTHLPCWKCLMLGLGCPFWVSCCSQEMPVTQVSCAVGRPGIMQPPSRGRGPELGAPQTLSCVALTRLSLNSSLLFSYPGVSDTPPVRGLIESPPNLYIESPSPQYPWM